MKELNEILKDPRIIKVYKHIETDKCLKVKMEVRSLKGSDKALVAFTRILDWEHLSVSFKNKIPGWEVMHEFKRMFWRDDEDAFQYHPAQDDYINNNEYTLHVWRPINLEIPKPPHITVGIRLNHLEEDKKAIRELQEMIGSPITEKELELMVTTCTPEGRKQIDRQLKNMELPEMLRLMAKFGY